MRNAIFIIAILFSIKSIGQQKKHNVKIDSCYVLNSDTVSGYFMNDKIENGKVQQFIRIKYETQSELVNPEGYRTFELNYDFLKLAEGKIENGERSGYWHFWIHNDVMSDQYHFCGGGNQYGINYQKDTLTYSECDYFLSKKIQYINDSLIVQGELSSFNNAIYFTCEEECFFYDKGTNNLVLKGQMEDLDWLLMQIEVEYLRKEKTTPNTK